ncbi:MULTISPECIES: hypothetical protein [Pseudomonas]|uniref:hypothetical protein n=1 Tax=Pseudomonas TaxID=286 RepID=UPI00123AFB98|nr:MULTISPECIES: hypothetical protein [Pseudomonas]QIB52918.1 hypothetical protein G3M63_18810 [Pseudomonas sp. OIL-1]
MKHAAIFLCALLPVAALAQERPAFGLSGSSVQTGSLPEARRMLEEQGRSGGAGQSELSVQLYIDTQQRIAETFRRPVPDDLTERTHGED